MLQFMLGTWGTFGSGCLTIIFLNYLFTISSLHLYPHIYIYICWTIIKIANLICNTQNNRYRWFYYMLYFHFFYKKKKSKNNIFFVMNLIKRNYISIEHLFNSYKPICSKASPIWYLSIKQGTLTEASREKLNY
jgi:hypothetical protein